MKLYLYVKQGLDYFFSIIFLILFSPVLIIVSITIKFSSPGPVLFRQKRIGKDKNIFQIYKFRTMREDTPKNTPTHLLGNPDVYITSVGKFLRKSSLDELPQLFNVLKGEMSFIGPRPALWNQSDLINARDAVGINRIKPGITGWAQVNGRDELALDVKVKYDQYYLNHIGFWIDIKILFKTIISVLTSKGVVEGANHDQQERR